MRSASLITEATPSRVDGVCFFSPYTRFGFSPRADLMLHGWAKTISSTIRPQDLIATVCPPIGLPEPGLTTTEVTPPDSASRKPSSAGLIASRARKRAPTGSVISLVSWPAQPLPSSCTPTWPCASTKPGSTHWPAASITSAFLLILILLPISAITPSRIRTVPPSIGSPTTGTTRPPTIASSP